MNVGGTGTSCRSLWAAVTGERSSRRVNLVATSRRTNLRRSGTTTPPMTAHRESPSKGERSPLASVCLRGQKPEGALARRLPVWAGRDDGRQ